MLVEDQRRGLDERVVTGVADRALRRARALWWPTMIFAVTVGSRVLASRHRRGYVLWPDEPAQLAFARFVAGGARWNMHNHSTWMPGYGLLVGFLGRNTSDPTDLYRVAMVTNAFLAGVAACVLYALTRRLTDLTRRGTAAAVMVAVMLPGSLFVTNFVWSEPLTVATLLGSILAMVAFDAHPTVARGLVAGGVAGAGFASHTRLLPLLGVVVASAMIALRRRHLSRTGAAGVALWCGALFVTVTVVSRALVEDIWNEPFERNSYGGLIGQLGHVHEAVIAMIGQGWYLAVTTGGLAVIGTIALIRAARSSGWDDQSVRRRSAARIALVVISIEFALSGVFMAGPWRGDHVVYGRYNDAFVGVLVVVGIASVLQHARRGTLWRPAIATVGLITASWFVLDRLRGDQLADGGGVDPMIFGLQAFGDNPSIPLGSITLVAICVVVATAIIGQLARRRWAPILLGCIAGLLLWAGNQNANDVVRSGWTHVADEPALAALSDLADVDDAAYYLEPNNDATGQMMRYQSVLPETHFSVVHSLDTPTIAAVFAPSHNPQLVDAGYHIVWRDPSHDLALWQQP